MLYARKGHLKKALDFFEQSLALDTDRNNINGIIANTINRSNIYIETGQSHLGEVYLVSAKSELEQVTFKSKKEYETIIRNNLALLRHLNGDTEAALSRLTEITAGINPKKKSHADLLILFNRAEMLSRMERYNEANEIYTDLLHYNIYNGRPIFNPGELREWSVKSEDKGELFTLPDRFHQIDKELFWRVHRGLANGLIYGNAITPRLDGNSWIKSANTGHEIFPESPISSSKRKRNMQRTSRGSLITSGKSAKPLSGKRVIKRAFRGSLIRTKTLSGGI